MNVKKPKRPALFAVVLMSLCLPLAGCQTMGSAGIEPVTSGATFCQGARPIRWSVQDTRATQDQVTEHNAVGKKLCGWGKKQ